jgi:hypothetical protein
MDKKTALREWRDVTRGAPKSVQTSRAVHDFAQRVEALAIARCDKRHASAMDAALGAAREAHAALVRVRGAKAFIGALAAQDCDAAISRLEAVLGIGD